VSSLVIARESRTIRQDDPVPVNLRAGAVVRSRDEEHRASTPLELFFDLTFVVAVARVSAELHHELVERHFYNGIIGFAAVFFAVWWAWMNFTWFASGHDADDVVYRLLTFVQMAGVLVLAAGVDDAFTDQDFAIVTLGYVVMRLAMVTQWLRIAAQHPSSRRRAMRYAVGIFAVQMLWVLRLVLTDDLALTSFVVLVLAELAVPVYAERASERPIYHPGHIIERYGLFTIIVLGESVLSATLAVEESIEATGISPQLGVVAFGALLIAFALWWIYFDHQDELELTSARASFLWGYGHLPVFAGLAAIGAGIQVSVESLDGHVSERVGALTVAIAVAVTLAGMSVLSRLSRSRRSHQAARVKLAAAALAVAVGAVASVPVTVLVIGLELSAVVALWLWWDNSATLERSA
jgi:low temperature requirement protein LtrA